MYSIAELDIEQLRSFAIFFSATDAVSETKWHDVCIIESVDNAPYI